MNRFASLTLTGLFATALLSAACGPVTQIPLPEEEPVTAASSASTTDVLSGHLTVGIPPGAVDAPRRASIMAAPQSSNDETRIVLEGGGPEGMAKFVMMVTELYLLGSGDLRADAGKLAARDEKVVELRGARLPTFAFEPGPGEPLPDRPLFVLGGVISHPDGTLQEVEFFILPEMAASRKDYTDRARAVLSTFAPGKRKIETAGGKTALGKTLFVNMPPSFILSTQPGPDFDVFRVRRLRRPGEPGATLGIYVGGHPSLQIDQLIKSGEDTPPAKTEEGTVLGRKTEWVEWRGADGLEIKETIVPLDDQQSVHVFAMATTVEDLEGLLRIVQTLAQAH
ncbi:MAG: hypothetical protein HOV80_34025 [Polyangiaceae bacterium]|nr:hypothetical protein [Polyangiaceae bacterium]